MTRRIQRYIRCPDRWGLPGGDRIQRLTVIPLHRYTSSCSTSEFQCPFTTYLRVLPNNASRCGQKIWMHLEIKISLALPMDHDEAPGWSKLRSKAGHQILKHLRVASSYRTASFLSFFHYFFTIFLSFSVTLNQCWRDSNEQCQNNDILWSWQEIVQSCDSQVGHILCLSKMRQLNWKIA